VEFDDENQNSYDLLQMRMLVTNDYKMTYYSPTGEILLFDRNEDPWEMRNLATEEEYRDIVRSLLSELLREISRTEPRLPRRYSGA
jgi:arylsulfatase A-like enzyme